MNRSMEVLSNMEIPVQAEHKAPIVDVTGRVRWASLLLCCSPLLLFRIHLLFTRPLLFDFITYWASGHLFLTGGDPYSVAAMFATERTQGWPYAGPLVLLCPPGTLPFISVMAMWPFRAGQIGWFAISLALNCLSALGLWIYFGGERRKAWVAILICATFIPIGGAELQGQVTPLMLASLPVFLFLVKSRKYFAAGMMLLGLGFKPHLLYLLALA